MSAGQDRLFRTPQSDVSSDDWYTPEWIFDGIGVRFDLDVAAPPGGVRWIPAREHFTQADDGLARPWRGVVWCNPPYSAPTEWCRRWATHEPGGVILIRADLSTRGPHAAYAAAHAIHFTERRLQFVNGQGGPTGAVTFSTVLLARGVVAVAGLHRLAERYGGATRDLMERVA